jgi:hypothetical protein
MESINRSTKSLEHKTNKQKRVILAQLGMEREQFYAEKARMHEETKRILLGGKSR